MKYSTLFIDLDDTLYINEDGLWAAIKERMSQYMIEKLDIPAETKSVEELTKLLLEEIPVLEAVTISLLAVRLVLTSIN